MPPFPRRSVVHQAASGRFGVCRSLGGPEVSLPRSYARSRVKPRLVSYLVAVLVLLIPSKRLEYRKSPVKDGACAKPGGRGQPA